MRLASLVAGSDVGFGLDPVPYPFNYDEVEDGGEDEGEDEEGEGSEDEVDDEEEQFVMPTFTNGKAFMGNPNYDEEDEVEEDDKDDFEEDDKDDVSDGEVS